MKSPDVSSSDAPMRSVDYWETLFSEEDPWKYGTSDYERWKTDLALGLIPPGPLRFAMEVGCAEGHMSSELAPRVERLLAVDISSKALARAKARCAGLAHVEFRQLDIVADPLPKQLDLILASEVLFYMSRGEVERVAKRFAEHLKVGGHVLLVHGKVVQDDPTRTGFDWGHEFGALTIGRIFGATAGLALTKEIETPLFAIQLFRRVSRAPKSLPAPQRTELPLPFDLELSTELERTILWDGAVMTRGEAQRTETADSVPILMYHAIGDDGPPELAPYRTTAADFRQQLRYLRSHGYHSLSLHDWVSSIAAGTPVPGRPVIITFDDGYQDFFETALPALERGDFTATVFVVTEKAGGRADWDELANPPRLMNWDEIRAAAARGITIGSHSASHQNFLRIPLERIRAEGERARQTLYEQLGHDVDLISFPWGSSSAEGRQVLAECGYRIGVRSWGGRSTLSDDPLELSRIEINGGDDLDTFIRKLEGEYAPAEPDTARQAPVSEATQSEVVEFSPARSVAPMRQDFPLPIDDRQQLASRLDALVGEFVKLQAQLLNDARTPMTAQKRLVNLFAIPVTGRVARTLQPGQEIIERVAATFENSARVILQVEPKADHSQSPESYLNTLKFELSGQTGWFSLNVGLDWREISLAERFQLSLYATCNRPVTCEAMLRLPRNGNPAHEEIFSTFTLSSHARVAVTSGELALPDFIKLDTSQSPELVFFFDTSDDFSLEINYLNCYFA